MSKTYTVKQVADALGFSTNTVYKYLEEGRIKATRLGSEGRFKIPEAEMIRLLGKEQPAPVVESSDPPIEPAPAIPESELYTVHKHNISDWIIAILGIFTGLSGLLFPAAIKPNYMLPILEQVATGIAVLLPLASILLIAFHTFVSHTKSKHIHLPSRTTKVCISALLFLLTFTSISSQQWTLGLFAFSIAVFSISSGIHESHSARKFLTLVAIISVFLPFSQLLQPETIGLEILQRYLMTNPIFVIALLLIIRLAGLGAIVVGVKTKSAFFVWTGALITTVMFLANTLNFITAQQWILGSLCLIFACFCFALPYYKLWDNHGVEFSRKSTFVWLISILAVGSAIILTLQTKFKQDIVNEALKESTSAAKIADVFVEDNLNTVQVLSQHPQAISILAKTTLSETDQQTIANIVKQVYQAGPSMRSLSIASGSGDTIAYYPPIEGEVTTRVNISDRDYFIQAKQNRQNTISDAINPKLGNYKSAIVIASPMFSEQDEVIGIATGSVDTIRLAARLSTANLNNLGSFSIADPKGVIFINTQTAPIEERLTITNRNNPFGYKSDRKLYLEAETKTKYGWSVVHSEPVFEAFKLANTTTYLIFITTILIGISGLFLAKPMGGEL